MQSDKAHVHSKRIEQKKEEVKSADDKNLKAVYKKSVLMTIQTPSTEIKAESEPKTPNHKILLKNFVNDQIEFEKKQANRASNRALPIINVYDKTEFDKKIAKYNYVVHRASLATTIEEDDQIEEPNKAMDSGKKN